MVIIGTLLGWFKKIPWYLQAVLGVIVVPNLIINGIIVYFYGLPWHSTKIHATIMTYEQRRDVQIATIIQRQLYVDQTTADSIKRIEQHQGVMYQALLNYRQPARTE